MIAAHYGIVGKPRTVEDLGKSEKMA